MNHKSLVALITVFLPTFAFCADEPVPKTDSNWIIQPEKLKTTFHTVNVAGKEIQYSATAGPLDLHDDKGNIKAKIFFVAYTKNDSDSSRPITFAFNGGPGSSSVWLHFGAFGPKKILTPEEGQTVIPPYRWVDNEQTILDLTDLVFIDPVGTGYSVPTDQSSNAFYDVNADIASVGDFIRDYITYFKRWLSPKYLVGESYGTTRAAGLGEYLQETNGIYLNGIVLISTALNFSTLSLQSSGMNYVDLLPCVLTLPSYTAVAWYHEKLPGQKGKTLETIIQEAKLFANKQYLEFLMNGDTFSEKDYSEMADALHNFTGLPKDLIARKNYRIDLQTFSTELFPGKTLGFYDGRYTGYYTNIDRINFFEDPSVININGIVTAVTNAYLRQELDYNGGASPYKILNLEANMKWDFSVGSPAALDVTPSLRRSLVVNPSLKIFVASGIYDLVTPFSGADYCFTHLGLPKIFYSNVQLEDYPAGHMMYLDKAVHVKLKNDLVKFYLSAD